MKNILVVCGAGMSTSLLVNKMKEADIDQEYSIKCSDTSSAHLYMLETDIFLLAPHMSYLKDEYEQKCKKLKIPFMLIDSLDYTHMDGKAVLQKARNVLEEYIKEWPFTIVLLHSKSGMMSDLLVMDMKKKVKEDEKTWKIQSVVVDDFDDTNVNVALLEPQISYYKEDLLRHLTNELTIILIPPYNLYATFDGRKILDYIKKEYQKQIDEKKIELKERIEIE